MTWRHVWRATATVWLVVVPCLWAGGRSQDAVQTVAWHWATLLLLAVSLASPSRRTFPVGWMLPALGLGAVLACAWHTDAATYPLLLLSLLTAWVGLWCLVTQAPTWDWIAQRLTWLLAVNALLWAVQCAGYDPIFERWHEGVLTPCGFWSRPNQLALLAVTVLPLANWTQPVAWVLLAGLGNWTALALAWGWAMARRPLGWVLTVVFSPVVVWKAWSLGWGMKLHPRLVTWDAALRQILADPRALLVGYGPGAWARMSPPQAGPWMFNAYLKLAHGGGLCLLLPVVATGAVVATSRRHPTRTALLLLAGMGLTMDVWSSPRGVVLTQALLACWLIGSAHADPHSGAVFAVSGCGHPDGSV